MFRYWMPYLSSPFTAHAQNELAPKGCQDRRSLDGCGVLVRKALHKLATSSRSRAVDTVMAASEYSVLAPEKKLGRLFGELQGDWCP